MAFSLTTAQNKLYRYVAPTLTGNTSLVTDRINSALERIYNSGKWKGLLASVVFNNSQDANQWWASEPVQYITLPRQFQAVLGIQFGAAGSPAIPRQVFPRWQEFIAGGMGQITVGASMQMAVDMGDGFVCYNTPTEPFYVKFVPTTSDDYNKVIYFRGTDPSGAALFDQNSSNTNTYGDSFLGVTLASGGTTCPITIGSLNEVIKPITKGPVNVFAVSLVDPTVSAQIATYEPTETNPSYKRYKLGASEYVSRVNCLCKRRYVPLVDVADGDSTIVPSNEGALKLTLMALQYEDKNDMERAEEYFNKAIQLLNAELKEDTGDPVITLQMNPLGAAMRIPQRY